MSARIIHLGHDGCHRVSVLTSAGYRVEECHTTEKLREALEAEPQPDGVVIDQEQSSFFREALALLHNYSGIPLILFGEPQRSTIAQSEFELVIPSLAPPDAWLSELAALIAQTQVARIRRRLPVKRADFTPRVPRSKMAGD